MAIDRTRPEDETPKPLESRPTYRRRLHDVAQSGAGEGMGSLQAKTAEHSGDSTNGSRGVRDKGSFFHDADSGTKGSGDATGPRPGGPEKRPKKETTRTEQHDHKPSVDLSANAKKLLERLKNKVSLAEREDTTPQKRDATTMPSANRGSDVHRPKR
jgi:hypothetical protein